MSWAWIRFETHAHALLADLDYQRAEEAYQRLRPHVQRLVLAERAKERARTLDAVERGVTLPAIDLEPIGAVPPGADEPESDAIK